jgi:hypothetical protein
MDCLAFESHFLDHMAPVWRLLPPQHRGRLLVDPSLIDRAARLGVPASPQPRPPHTDPQPKPNTGYRPAFVASYGDLKEARRLGYGPFAFLEHGAGQTYNQRQGHSAYGGGTDHDDNELFLVPNENSARRWRASYPNARVEIVGCPKLDYLPLREYSKADFIGLESALWNGFGAAIQQRQRTFGSTVTAGVCAAHAIADASQSALGARNSPGTCPRPTTTSGDALCYVPMGPPHECLDLVEHLTEAVRLATSTCTDLCGVTRSRRVISVDELMAGLRLLSVGILLRKRGGSSRDVELHSALIPTTTSGFVSLAIPTTTAKVAITEQAARPVVCSTFHWEAPISISGYAGSALNDYLRVLPALAAAYPGRVIGHCHPSATWPPRMKRVYKRAGIPFVADFEEVCRVADLLIFDNTSAGFEFAATGRPVVVLNARYWSREYNAGPPRFWEAADVGINVNRPEDLVPAVREALVDAPSRQEDREEALQFVYGLRTNGAAVAATAITDWLASAEAAAA